MRAFFSRNKLLLIVTPALVFLAMAATILIQSNTVSDLRWRAVSYDANLELIRDEVKDFTLSEWVVLSVDAFKKGEFDLPVDACATRDNKPGIMLGARCTARDANNFSYYFSLNAGIPLDLGNLRYLANLESISLLDKGGLSGLEVFPELNELESFMASDMEVDVCAVARAPNIRWILTATEILGDSSAESGRKEIEEFIQSCN